MPEWLLNNGEKVDEFFALATSVRHSFKIGFDSCSISGVMSYTNVHNSTVEACDAGRFSMYISEEMKAFPCSFYSDNGQGVTITDQSSFLQAWQHSYDFKNARNYFLSDQCNCDFRSRCLNGCPLFPEIRICRPIEKSS